MIPAITSALGKGFTAKQVVSYLMRQFPNHRSSIEKSLAAGFTAEQVLKYLSRNSGENLESPQHQVNTSYSRIRDEQQRRTESQEKNVLSGVGMVAGALAAPKVASTIGSLMPSPTPIAPPPNPNAANFALNRALPNQLKPQLGALPNSAAPPNPIPTPPSTPQAPIMQAPITQAAIQPTPGATAPITPKIAENPQKAAEFIRNLGEEDRIRNLTEGGLSSTDIAGVLRKILPKEKIKALESYEGGLEKAIEDYAQTLQNQSQEQQEVQSESPQLDAIQPPIERREEPIEEIKPIQKAETVITPHGVGEVKEIRNGKAIVEVDGKKHKVDVKEIEATGFTDEEIANAYEDLMSKIPEEHRSGFISWAGYDEDTNTLGFIPRGGKYEEIHNITPEEAQRIKEGKGIARTSGKNTEGLWVAGEDTRGGIISQIIHDRRKAKKAESDKQGTLFDLPKKEKEDRGMKPLFDEMAYAREKSKEREKRRKDAEREAKKRKKQT